MPGILGERENRSPIRDLKSPGNPESSQINGWVPRKQGLHPYGNLAKRHQDLDGSLCSKVKRWASLGPTGDAKDEM
jgi:hypothetical protein